MRIHLLIIVIFVACQQADPEKYRLSADFHPNEKIYVVFTPNESILDLISTLSQYENTGVFVKSDSELAFADSVLNSWNTNMKNVRIVAVPNLDIWVRDNGPAILRNKNGLIRAVDFRSNIIEFEHNDMGIAQHLNIPLVRSRIMSVGGARETNGEGVILMTENFYLAKSKKIRKDMIEKELREHCGIDEVIWLKKGLVEDELFSSGPVYQNIYPAGTGGHIDEFCRFVNEKTVLLAQVDPDDLNKHPLYLENHNRLEENHSLLRPLENKGFTVIRIPTAEFVFRKETDPLTGSSFEVVTMSSYLNFVIGNNVIIAAKYYEEGMPESILKKDQQVLCTLQEQFPNHKVVQLNPKHLNARGGGYHCMTFNLPKKGD